VPYKGGLEDMPKYTSYEVVLVESAQSKSALRFTPVAPLPGDGLPGVLGAVHAVVKLHLFDQVPYCVELLA